jgi:hypothetical protein
MKVMLLGDSLFYHHVCRLNGIDSKRDASSRFATLLFMFFAWTSRANLCSHFTIQSHVSLILHRGWLMMKPELSIMVFSGEVLLLALKSPPEFQTSYRAL